MCSEDIKLRECVQGYNTTTCQCVAMEQNMAVQDCGSIGYVVVVVVLCAVIVVVGVVVAVRLWRHRHLSGPDGHTENEKDLSDRNNIQIE